MPETNTTPAKTDDAAGADQNKEQDSNTTNGQKSGGGETQGQAAAAISFATEAEFQARVDSILKDRLDRQGRKAQEAADRKAAEETGQWQKLAEKYKADLDELHNNLQETRFALLRRDVAATLNVPAVLTDRLQGTTKEEIEADAKRLMSSLPKPAPASANAGTGAGQKGAGDGRSMNSFIRAAAGRGAS